MQSAYSHRYKHNEVKADMTHEMESEKEEVVKGFRNSLCIFEVRTLEKILRNDIVYFFYIFGNKKLIIN